MRGGSSGQNHWARDFIFVFGDDYIEGVEAFLASYHGMADDGEQYDRLSKDGQENLLEAVSNRINRRSPGPRTSRGHLGRVQRGLPRSLLFTFRLVLRRVSVLQTFATTVG